MKKKSFISLLLITLLLIGTFSACSSSGGGEKTADKDFIKSVGKGLDARWNIQYAKGDDDEDLPIEDFRKAVQAEYDAVEGYKSASFEDSVLQEKALKYINIMNECLENIEYAYAENEEYLKWSDLYDQRTVLIKDFADNYDLKVSDKNKKYLDELVADGKAAGAQAKQKEAVEGLVKNLEFELVENDYGWKTYEAILDNTTDYDIISLDLDISLLDSEGVIVKTEYSNVENVSKGQKAKVEFNTEAEFDRIEPIINYLEAK